MGDLGAINDKPEAENIKSGTQAVKNTVQGHFEQNLSHKAKSTEKKQFWNTRSEKYTQGSEAPKNTTRTTFSMKSITFHPKANEQQLKKLPNRR